MIDLLPGLIIALLLIGAAVAAAAASYQPRWTRVTAVSTAALAFLLWLTLRLVLPILPDANRLPAAWHVDGWTWALGGAWLLLLLAALLLRLQAAPAAANKPVTRFPQSSLMLLLGGVTLTAVWAGTPALVVTTWSLLALVWAAAAALLRREQPDLAAVNTWAAPAAGLLLSALGLWYAAALGGGADWSTWTAAARTAALLAILAQMAAGPLLGRRALAADDGSETAVLLLTGPALAGAAMLVRLAATGPMPALLPMTLIGLLVVLLGLRRVWAHLAEPAPMGMGLLLVQIGWLLLAALWAGPAAAAAEARVLALAAGFLFLAVRGVRADMADPVGRGLRLAGWLLALAALAGLPLTAGFNGRAGLYTAWLAAGGWPLVVVAALLHGMLITAVCLSALSRPDGEADAPSSLITQAARLLLAIGLLALPVALAQTAIGTWLALLLPMAAGVAAVRFAPDGPAAAAVVQRSTAVRVPTVPWRRWARLLARLLTGALRDAAVLLEGERGLLWLLLLAALIVLLGSG
ncbi:MAG: hypothetical protein IPJ94_16250 [Chloroflexi bacterium]|nr:hypothetical protein [Chloroflexota bacterium]